ncbi:unnamed protein product [Tuber aestivum]|uniref:Uncharacterized protein n=1 Tax=Tuber aestivum TaxID=59557 RepID=A0A292PYM1_9PEZI|nr:unnamed protein product [Tuber aestivum]
MGKTSLGVTRRDKIPKHITEISMTSDKCYELKVYIKSIVVPGTPAFDCRRLGDRTKKRNYQLWLHNTLKEIGPRFFPSNGRGLVWPKDYDKIYKTVHQVVRVLSIGIRRGYRKKELRVVQGERW